MKFETTGDSNYYFNVLKPEHLGRPSCYYSSVVAAIIDHLQSSDVIIEGFPGGSNDPHRHIVRTLLRSEKYITGQNNTRKSAEKIVEIFE